MRELVLAQERAAALFAAIEADFGRSYVLGSDPQKLSLHRELAKLFQQCRDFYLQRPSLTGAELFEHVVTACSARGFGFGGEHAGHLVGPFAMSRAVRDAAENRIRPDNHVPMNAPDSAGKFRCWILEIHLLDATGTFGGFYEDLLNLP
jgi:hypothetical protein